MGLGFRATINQILGGDEALSGSLLHGATAHGRFFLPCKLHRRECDARLKLQGISPTAVGRSTAAFNSFHLHVHASLQCVGA